MPVDLKQWEVGKLRLSDKTEHLSPARPLQPSRGITQASGVMEDVAVTRAVQLQRVSQPRTQLSLSQSHPSTAVTVGVPAWMESYLGTLEPGNHAALKGSLLSTRVADRREDIRP